jgi:hypothetical protein
LRNLHIAMKLALTLLLGITLVASATDKRTGTTRFKLMKSQIQEFDETGWITLTPDQKSELQRRTGISPTRVQPIYDQPDGAVAELGYNLALKTAGDEIKVLHEFLMSDDEATKKHQRNLQMTSGAGATKDVPSFAIDSHGKLWKWISRKEFEDYVARDPKNIMTVYFQVPSSMPSTNTVASADTLRQVTEYCEGQRVPTYVINKH